MANTLYLNDTEFIKYFHNKSPQNRDFGILFLPGMKSDMNGTKSMFFRQHCQEQNIDFTTLEYFGHGKSSGKFENGTISIWLENVLSLIDKIIQKPQIIIGSSLGGWLMSLLALKKPEIAKALIGIAIAPDFICELPDAPKGKTSVIVRKDDYEIEFQKSLIEDAKNYLILNKSININCPIRLMHAIEDDVVSYKKPLEFAQLVTSEDVKITLIKNSNHRFSGKTEIELFKKTIEELI